LSRGGNRRKIWSLRSAERCLRILLTWLMQVSYYGWSWNRWNICKCCVISFVLWTCLWTDGRFLHHKRRSLDVSNNSITIIQITVNPCLYRFVFILTFVIIYRSVPHMISRFTSLILLKTDFLYHKFAFFLILLCIFTLFLSFFPWNSFYWCTGTAREIALILIFLLEHTNLRFINVVYLCLLSLGVGHKVIIDLRVYFVDLSTRLVLKDSVSIVNYGFICYRSTSTYWFTRW
jgi:hypothetical protein